jgi:small-conductance mechanosensitive channel
MNLESLGVTGDLSSDALLKLIASALVVLFATALRWLAPVLVRAGERYLSNRQRWWINFVNKSATALVAAALVAIWADEIESAALSLAAFAVAFVFAMREMIACVIGALWRDAARPFRVGDWVEIGGFSGEVIEETLLATRLQELDKHDLLPTGRAVSVPNSLIIGAPVINHSFGKRFVALEFLIHAEPSPDALPAKRRIEAALAREATGFMELARRYVARIERNVGLQLRDPAPRVALETTEMAKIVYRVSAFCPQDRAEAMRETAMSALLDAPALRAAAE